MNNQKEFWKSKTFWINTIAMIVFLVQIFWDQNFIIQPQVQGAILAVINFILRLVTKEEIVWSKDKSINKK